MALHGAESFTSELGAPLSQVALRKAQERFLSRRRELAREVYDLLEERSPVGYTLRLRDDFSKSIRIDGKNENECRLVQQLLQGPQETWNRGGVGAIHVVDQNNDARIGLPRGKGGKARGLRQGATCGAYAYTNDFARVLIEDADDVTNNPKFVSPGSDMALDPLERGHLDAMLLSSFVEQRKQLREHVVARLGAPWVEPQNDVPMLSREFLDVFKYRRLAGPPRPVDANARRPICRRTLHQLENSSSKDFSTEEVLATWSIESAGQ